MRGLSSHSLATLLLAASLCIPSVFRSHSLVAATPTPQEQERSQIQVRSEEQGFLNFRSEDFDKGVLGPYPNRTYYSRPDLVSPQLNVQEWSPQCNDGLFVFISLRGDKVGEKGQAPMIHDSSGNLVWMNSSYGETFGLDVQRYMGRDYLTFWKGDDAVGGHGEGVYVFLDENYQEAFRLAAPNGTLSDLHEFNITPEGTALITQYLLRKAPMTYRRRVRDGYIWDSVFHEVTLPKLPLTIASPPPTPESESDPAGAEVAPQPLPLLSSAASKDLLSFPNLFHPDLLFSFSTLSSPTFPLSTSYFPPSPEQSGLRPTSGWDFYHINSVDKDSSGNYLISSRYYNAISYVSGSTGEVIWTLGGAANNFTATQKGFKWFEWQHDARWVVLSAKELEILNASSQPNDSGVAEPSPNSEYPDTIRHMTLFDNSARYGLRPHDSVKRRGGSRGLLLELNTDPSHMTVRVLGSWLLPPDGGIISASQGSVQFMSSESTGLRSRNEEGEEVAESKVLMGFGHNAAYSEFSLDGTLLCTVHIGTKKNWGSGAVQTYKVHKRTWVGKPLTLPNLSVSGAEKEHQGIAYISWNGATEVKEWVLWGSTVSPFVATSDDSNGADTAGTTVFRRLGSTPKATFETRIGFQYDAYCFVVASAIDKDGVEIGRSEMKGTGVGCDDLEPIVDTEETYITSTLSDDGSMTSFSLPSYHTLLIIASISFTLSVLEFLRRRVWKRSASILGMGYRALKNGG